MNQQSASGRVGRFVDAYGWRAYAVPVLAVVTVLVLISVLRGAPSSAQEQSQGLTGAMAAGATTTSPVPTETPAEPVAAEPAAPAAPTAGYLEAGTGQLATVPGTAPVAGTGGPLYTYAVQVEGGIDIDAAAFATRVDGILADPRSWVGAGQVQLQRIDAGTPSFYIMLVTPAHVESHCPGYQTNGFTSCRNGDRVVINLARWSVGVTDYDGHLDAYRDYVINHEVGHFLGYHHVDCPGPGAKSPVMQQQTLGLEGCVMNAWPYPNSPADDPNRPA